MRIDGQKSGSSNDEQGGHPPTSKKGPIDAKEIGVSTKEGFREHCAMVHIGPGFRPKVERDVPRGAEDLVGFAVSYRGPVARFWRWRGVAAGVM